jgi:hypothetical protein
LKKNLESIQGKNLSQQQRIFSNGNNSQASSNSEYDLNARAQWTRLAQAQELAVARVRPLRVNLPISGLHEAFTQVLQTESEKPLTIQFFAANTQTGSRFRQFIGGVLALLLLWSIVMVLLARPARAPQPA